MAKLLKFGVIGLGDYPSQYHIPHIMANGNAELTAICDVSEDRLSEVQEQTKVEHAFGDLNAMLNDTVLDVLVVSTPHAFHYEHARTALERGLNVLVDKPFVLDVTEAQQLVALAEKKGVKLMVGLNRHLDPADLAARHAIQNGEIGDIVFVRTLQVGYPTDRFYTDPKISGGGPLIGRGTHMGALIPWLTGLRPLRLTANILWGDQPVDIGGILNIELEKNVLWQLASVSNASQNIDEIDIHGTAGRILLWRPVATVAPWSTRRWGADGQEIEVGELPQGQTTTDHFIDFLNGQDELRVPLIHAVYSTAIVQGAYESVRLKRPIQIAEDGTLSPLC